MLNEFYKYIARLIINFFDGHKDTLRPGDRYCLRLDSEEMVESLHYALCRLTELDHIQGSYSYENLLTHDVVYETITIKLDPPEKAVVVASQINGMKENFLATLRNAERSTYNYPILTITHSRIDTITSATGDLSEQGMPFHADSMRSAIQEHIRIAMGV